MQMQQQQKSPRSRSRSPEECEIRWWGLNTNEDFEQFPSKPSADNPLKEIHCLWFDNQYDFEFENGKNTDSINNVAI